MNATPLKKPTLVAAALALSLSACSTTRDGQLNENQKAQAGAVIGAITGAVIAERTGSEKNRKRNRVLGAIAGATVGGVVGKNLDESERLLREELAAERSRREIELQRMDANTLKLTLNNEVSFDTNSAAVKPGFYGSLNKVADVLSNYPDFSVMVVGHTDSVGSEQHNQVLSQNRASSVASYLASRGVNSSRIQATGRGEYEPRASNDNAQGRAQNRRVEIFISE